MNPVSAVAIPQLSPPLAPVDQQRREALELLEDALQMLFSARARLGRSAGAAQVEDLWRQLIDVRNLILAGVGLTPAQWLDIWAAAYRDAPPTVSQGEAI